MNRISAIIPAFNAAATLGETLESVMMQTRAPDEVIVVDDGSTDSTAQIACAHSGVRVVRQPNGGVARALNTGVQASRSDFLAFLDADDLWMPACLETHEHHFADRSGMDASVGWCVEFICPSLSDSQAARFRPRPAQPGWLAGATIVRRSALDSTGEFEASLRVGAWIDWVDRARRRGLSFEVIDETVLRRRLRPGSLSTSSGLMEVARRALSRRRPSLS